MAGAGQLLMIFATADVGKWAIYVATIMPLPALVSS